MKISIEISYYPLKDDYSNPVKEFIHAIADNSRVMTDPGVMSTIISGDYEDVMLLLVKTIKPIMEKYPSVFTLKITNACKTFKNQKR